MIKISLNFNFYSQKEYEKAVEKKEFSAATEVWLDNMPGVTSLPDMPAATHVWLYNMPGVTSLPDMPKTSIYRD